MRPFAWMISKWDHVVGLAKLEDFTQLKPSLKELPQLRANGLGEDQAGVQEDWHGRQPTPEEVTGRPNSRPSPEAGRNVHNIS